MANNEHSFPVPDTSHPDTTILDEDGMTEPHVAKTDDSARPCLCNRQPTSYR
jgi:hypothetical protein